MYSNKMGANIFWGRGVNEGRLNLFQGQQGITLFCIDEIKYTLM